MASGDEDPRIDGVLEEVGATGSEIEGVAKILILAEVVCDAEWLDGGFMDASDGFRSDIEMNVFHLRKLRVSCSRVSSR